MNSDEQLETLRAAAALRVEGRRVPESVRRSLAAVEARLLELVGPLVRKRVAARLLGCSVQALDRWVAKGVLPVEPIADGATRMALPTDAVVAVAAELAWLQEDATIGRAVRAWQERRDRHAEIRDADQLNVDLHIIAEAARRRSAA